MSLREKIAETRINDTVAREKFYHFPEFVKLLRKTLGITQRAVSEQSKINEKRLFRIESLNFFLEPSNEELETLAEYYGIPLELLQKKLKQYKMPLYQPAKAA